MSGENILLVDDERSITDLLKLHLEEEGYTTVSAQSVDKALKALERGPVDLVMLDIRMPGRDGFDFLREINTKHGRSKVPVIVMTGRGELQSLTEGSAVEGFVNKPFEMSLVLAEVKRVLSRKEKAVYIADIEGSAPAQALAKALREERYQVFFVKDMNAVNEYWARQPADYILMEYQQHAIAGGQLIRELRSRASDIPIIVYSYSGMDFKTQSLAAGASVYLGEPKDPDAFVTAIREFEVK